jgi:hypothetical protein
LTFAPLFQAGQWSVYLVQQNKPMIQKPFAAHRRVIAVEISNMLSLRRTMKRLRGELQAGRSATEMLHTPRGDIPRYMLLRFAEVSFEIGLKKVCAARRVLFRLATAAGEGAKTGASAGVTKFGG